MTILNSTRLRIFVACAAPVVLASAFLLFAHRISCVRAAEQAVLVEGTHAPEQLATLPAARPNTTSVLVELFTSEGCSSCPPADALLAHLQDDQPLPAANIIVLEEHVDYWDSLGWHDPFSSRQVTDRQRQYQSLFKLDDVYTPQMIVDGSDQFSGNDSAHALRAVSRAAHMPRLALTLSSLTFDGTHLSGTVSLATPSASTGNADLYATVVEAMASTHVLSGENGGRTLNHVSVLRTLQRIGSPANATGAPLKFSLAVPKDISVGNLRVVVFAQLRNQGAVLGAVSSSIAATSAPATSVASAHLPPLR